MTIYTIVNHILGIRPEEEIVWTLISSNCILQGGNPYFVPDFANRFEARPALAIKIGKLGKGVQERFAGRYIQSVAPCLMMVAADKLHSLRSSGFPWSEAISYDRSVAFGRFVEISPDEIERCTIGLTLQSAGKSEDFLWKAEHRLPPIGSVIAQVSRDNTLKTGDIIIAGAGEEGPEVKIGMKALLTLNGDASPGFNIR